MSARTLTITDPTEVRDGDLLTLRHEDGGVTVTGPAGGVRDRLCIYGMGAILNTEGGDWGRWDFVSATREVPEVAPGTTGTATVRGVEGVRVVRSDDERWLTPVTVDEYHLHLDGMVADFVPAPDTTALRAEVERLGHRAQSAEQERTAAQSDALTALARADAAEARLARVTEHAIANAIIERYSSFDRLSARGIAQAVLALAHGPLTTPHFTIHEDGSVEQNVALGCTCKTVNVGGCLAGCTDERVIDRTCPEHGEKVSDV